MRTRNNRMCAWLLACLLGGGMLCMIPGRVAANELDGKKESYIKEKIVLGLYCMKETGKDTVEEEIPAYSLQNTPGSESGEIYARIMVEDTAWIAEETANRMEEILLNTYPHIPDMEALTASANQLLFNTGGTPVSSLKPEEAALGTGQALRMLLSSETELPSGWNSNASGICSYLLSLASSQEETPKVTQPVIENVQYRAVPAEDGRYGITVTFSVSNSPMPAEALTVSAICADQTQVLVPSTLENINISFQGISGRAKVELEVRGNQTEWELALFSGQDGVQSGNILVGLHNHVREIYAKTTASPDRIINIFLTSRNDQRPLANMEFGIYRTDIQEKGQQEPSAFQTQENLMAVIKTNVQGYASFNFTDHGLPDGIYVIAEQDNPAICSPVETFFVSVPGTTEDGLFYAYTQAIHLQNQPEQAPQLQLHVTESGRVEDSFAAGELHSWILRGEIPAGIADAEKYVISNVLDSGLTFSPESLVVMLYSKSGEVHTLVADRHYTQNEETDKKGRCGFSVMLTGEGMAYIAQNLASGESIPEIRVCYKAFINENAKIGTRISSQAQLSYTNTAGINYVSQSGTAGIYTGGAAIQVTGLDGGPVSANAVFRLAREATKEELRDPVMETDVLTVNGKQMTVVYERFYASPELTGEKAYEVSTDAQGRAGIYGLAWGTYYLVECRPGSGHTSQTEPIRISIHKYSHLTRENHKKDDEGNVIDNTIWIQTSCAPKRENGEVSDWILTLLSFFSLFRSKGLFA